jgi:hypothetical protein
MPRRIDSDAIKRENVADISPQCGGTQMANSVEKPAAPDQPEKEQSYFPIELTELELSNVVGGVVSHVQTAGAGGIQTASTIMCCW